jgi:signal transduction histidine kinase
MVAFTTLIAHQSCVSFTCSIFPPYIVTEAGPVIGAWLAIEEQKLVGQPLSEVVAARSSLWLTLIDQCAESGESQRVDDVAHIWPDGKQRTVSIFCSPLLESQQVFFLVIEMPNPSVISPSLNVEHVPNELEQLKESINLIPTPLWIYDSRSRLRAVNDSTLRLFGLTTFESLIALIGANLSDHIACLRPRMTTHVKIARAAESSYSTSSMRNADEPNRLWASENRREFSEQITRGELAIARALQRHPVSNQIISIILPHQEAECILRTASLPVINSNGRLLGAVLLTEDITGELLQYGRNTAMLTIASHDLRNAITPSRLYLQFAIKKMRAIPGLEQNELQFQDGLRNLERIEEIADDLDVIALGHSRESSRSTTDLVSLIHTIINNQAGRYPMSRVVLQSSQLEITGYWGQRYLQWIIAMLLANAARRSPPGRNIMIKLKQLQSKVRVEVIDQGEILSPTQLERIHTALEYGGAALARSEGTDIDLSIVQTVLGLYNSRLSVTSRPRQGTNFKFDLPLRFQGED